MIGSRTYEWKGNDVLRCKHWDKVAIRWHVSSCSAETGECKGGTNVDYARTSQNSTEMPIWRNAFSYVQLPNMENGEKKYLKLGLSGYDKRKTVVESISPLKIDVDWKWQLDKHGCNHFTVRMSAMSMINPDLRRKLESFCHHFDLDHFVDCKNL
ncbi:unnamed protein product [Caenorhabditis angaria]|uniref:Uncharacterized protein n=1 Tax=Caenorhabditis angaria TaxID=860376 RepID=A0A9P1IU19_9PELO|nr:unnamed protein product [Caenorhabditis angaria]